MYGKILQQPRLDDFNRTANGVLGDMVLRIVLVVCQVQGIRTSAAQKAGLYHPCNASYGFLSLQDHYHSDD